MRLFDKAIEKTASRKDFKRKPVIGSLLFILGIFLIIIVAILLIDSLLSGSLLEIFLYIPLLLLGVFEYKTGKLYISGKCKAVENAPKSIETTPNIPDHTPVSDYAQRRADAIERKKLEFSQSISEIPQVPITLSEERTKRANMIEMPEIKYTNITRSTNLQKLFPLVVVDTETTGVKPGGNDIIEVSAIKYAQDFTPISCFTTLCKPRKPIPADATEINNITNEMVANSPPFALVATAFSEYISGCNVVGHNLGFDLRFLFISGVELPPKAKYYDTLELSKKVLTKYGSKKYNHKTGEYEETEDWDVYNYKLETLCEYYDIHRSDSHRSLSDCYATAQLFENLIKDKTS